MQTVTVAELSFDILMNNLHRPLVEGKANREKIEDAITVGILNKELGYVDQETVDLAIELIDDLVIEHGVNA
jgi:hypothetical protein